MTDSVVIVDEEPATDNWKIIGGNSFIAEYDLRDDRTEPVSLINVVATLTMRATTEDPSTIVLINSSVISTTGLILVDTSLGVVKCYFNPDQTRNLLNVTPSRLLVFSIDLSDGSDVFTIIRGNVSLTRVAGR